MQEDDVITIDDFENEEEFWHQFIDDDMTGNEKYLQICILKNLVLSRSQSERRP